MQDIKKKFWLEKFYCFSITGKDARKFLNGITTGNILDLENKVIKTCWLTPKGVLRSLIEIIFLERSLEVIILAGNTNEIIDYFNQIIFPADDVLLSEPSLIHRIQEIDVILITLNFNIQYKNNISKNISLGSFCEISFFLLILKYKFNVY